jgi:D-serine deaminase-like pyridoxal phosphate-dependent protein
MADLAATAGVALRPHVKSHKTALVARLQLEHGAVGLACAKLAEAEAVVDALAGGPDGDGGGNARDGRVGILLTSPLAGRPSAELAAAVRRTGGRLGVLCDVDVGLGRTGVVDPAGARAVARRITAAGPVLSFGGVQGYAGHLQHTAGRAARRDGARDAALRLTAVVDALEADGHEVRLRTGGGTGTSGLDVELGLLNELQPGSYVFMDREYRDALGDDPEGRFHQSLTVATTVVSANQTGFATVDAGLKAMATDTGPPVVVGAAEGVEYLFFGDEHGLVTDCPAGPRHRGDRLELVPPHCDPTVDRYDAIWLVRGDEVVGRADVVARGRSQ